jgi:hypothetical protein
MERLILIACLFILGLVGYGLSQYKGPEQCPTTAELQAHEWQCDTDASCNSEYLETFNSDPHICGDEV